MQTDIEIARAATLAPIAEVAAAAGIPEAALVPYGRHKAKIDLSGLSASSRQGKLILVTAINPTPAGEGKTTTSVGLSDALHRIGKKAMLCLREPSLGPCFGVKGGGAGGGHSQVMPMDEINLHFTGDFHAITSAHNLLSAMIDNHIYWGNALEIDLRRVTWRRVIDMNDRALRQVVGPLGGVANGFPRETGFDITVASEIMAILCLASGIEDLERRGTSSLPIAATRARCSAAMSRPIGQWRCCSRMRCCPIWSRRWKTARRSSTAGPLPISPTAAIPRSPPAPRWAWPIMS